MYPALADTFSLLFYFIFWWVVLLMLNFTSAFIWHINEFHWIADGLVATGLSYFTVLLSKVGGSSA